MVTSRKLVVVGPNFSGKTYIVQTFVNDEVKPSLVSIVQFFTTDVKVGNQYVELEIIDLTGATRYFPTLKDFFETVDVCLVIFSVYSRSSFENVKEFWIPETKKLCKGPFLLVGNLWKNHLFRNETMVTCEEAQQLAEKVGAVGYVECLADQKYNLEKVFEDAVAATLT